MDALEYLGIIETNRELIKNKMNEKKLLMLNYIL